MDIPRDRKGEFEPHVVRKNQTDIPNIEDYVLSMYATGMTTRDISAHLRDVYGVKASAEMISHMTDRILLVAKEWQNSPSRHRMIYRFIENPGCHRQPQTEDKSHFGIFTSQEGFWVYENHAIVA